jgi:hypothetical protein
MIYFIIIINAIVCSSEVEIFKIPKKKQTIRPLIYCINKL